MRNIKSRGILMRAGLLGAGAVLGLSQPMLAQTRRDVKEARQDVKEARQDVREERRDVRQADTRKEVRQEQRELTAAQRGLQQQQVDLQRERQQREWQQRQQQGYRGPNYRPGYNHQSRNFRTLEGRVVEDLRGDSFVMRTYGGEQVHVHRNNEPSRISRGDVVRVYGYSSNGVFHAQNLTTLRNR
jgi:uncharacterized protein YdeI (BOF family)